MSHPSVDEPNNSQTDALRIVRYPHPTLRLRSKPIKRIDAHLCQVARHMFQLMYEAKGVGLAGNQVNIPLRLFVVNLAACPGEGEERVFINPVISQPKGWQDDEEGCLSLPGIYAPVGRPKRVVIQAYDLEGNEIVEEVSGLLARVVQHEVDHLDGVLFIDRLVDGQYDQEALHRALAHLESQFQQDRQAGVVPSDDVITEQVQGWLQRYT